MIEYSNNYAKTPESLNNDGVFVHFDDNKTADSFKFQVKLTGQASNNDARNVEIMVNWNISVIFGEPLKCH